MPAVLMTVPHALIDIVNVVDGRVDHPQIGATVNVYGASLSIDGADLRVDLPSGKWRWIFHCASHDEARKYHGIFATRGQR